MKKFLLPVALALSTAMYAGGFRVSLQGVRQLAQAHTSAHTEDASVAFFNPAGISFVPAKLSIAAGGFALKPQVTFQDMTTLSSTTTHIPVATPVYAAVTYKVLDNLSVGLSVTTPFGTHLVWDKNWEGREVVQDIDLKSFFITPMVSVKLAPWISIGMSYIHVMGTLDWNRSATLINGELNLKNNHAKGNGFGVGFYFRPQDNLDISVAYRSRIDAKADNGKAQFSGVSSSLYPLLGLDSNGADTFNAMLPLPSEWTIGATYKVTPQWSISADLNYTGWEDYEALRVKFAHAQLGNQPNDPTLSVTPKNWHNTKTYRVGTEYWFTDKIAGRLGYYYDEAPYGGNNFSPETPSFNANVVTGGLGFKVTKRLGVDVSAAYEFLERRGASNSFYNINGQMKGYAFDFGLGLSYNVF